MSAHSLYTPNAAMAACAKRGLKLRERFGRGGTEVGVRRADDLIARKPIDIGEVRHIASYFARHAIDKDAAGFASKTDPSAGLIAWLLWGGDPGQKWSKAITSRADKAEIEPAN